MPQYIQVGNDVIEFPDGMTDEQIAAALKGQAQQPVAETITTEKPSMLSELGRQVGLTARAGIAGLSTVPNAVADFLSGAANLGLQAVGSEQRVPYLSQMQQQALEQAFPTPRPGLEQKVQTAAEAVAGLMSPGMKVPTAPLESATAKEIGRRAASEAAATATAAVVGQEAAQKAMEVTGSPWAALAAGLATGTVVGSATGKAMFALSGPRKEPVTIDQIKQRASRGFQEMDEAGISLKTATIKNKLIPNIETELKAANFDPDIVSAHKDIQDNLKLFQKITSDPFVDFGRLEKIRSTFSGLSQGSDDAARLARIVRDEIDSYLGSFKPSDILSLSGKETKKTLDILSKARQDWRNQSRAQVLQDILDSATARIEGATGPTGDIVRQKLVNLTSNVDKMKQFSTREQNIIRAASQSTDLDSLLSILSKFNPQRGYAQTATASAAAAATATGQGAASLAGMAGLGLAGGGYLADKALAATRQREMRNLIGQIASGNLQTPKQGFAIPGLFGATVGSTEEMK